MAVNVIGQRMNSMVILHGCWLVAILTRRRREAIARLWPNYCLFLTLFLLYQYLLCLGMPPALCVGEYPCLLRVVYLSCVPQYSAHVPVDGVPAGRGMSRPHTVGCGCVCRCSSAWVLCHSPPQTHPHAPSAHG